MSAYPEGFGVGSTLYGKEKHRPWDRGAVEMVVAGETSRSWLVCAPCFKDSPHMQTKIPKNKVPDGYWLTLAEYEETCWVGRNAYRIGEAVRSVRDPALLRRIAALVNYTEPTVEKSR